MKHPGNPIITTADVAPSRPDFKVVGVFNAGVARYEAQTLLLLRVAEAPVQNVEGKVLVPLYDSVRGSVEIRELDNGNGEYDTRDPRVVRARDGQNYLTSISHMRVAKSPDGVRFEIEKKPFIKSEDCYTAFGAEDARIARIGEHYYISYSAASEYGIVVRLAKTRDFVTYEACGNIFHPDNKDVALFPEKIGGLYYGLHRPSTSEYGRPNMWIASSPDLLHWGDHRLLAAVRPGSWDSGRIGASAVPFLTEKGWLEIYHGATRDNRYCLGVMLLDREEPWKLLARSELTLMEPDQPYETQGFFGNVVFSCGALEENGRVSIYYGAADESVCLAATTTEHLLSLLKA